VTLQCLDTLGGYEMPFSFDTVGPCDGHQAFRISFFIGFLFIVFMMSIPSIIYDTNFVFDLFLLVLSCSFFHDWSS
jgi:hypothetical protein